MASLSSEERSRYGIRKPEGVLIPYYKADGSEARCRQRTALAAKEGSFWPGSSDESIHPYGEHDLAEARKRKAVPGDYDGDGVTDFAVYRPPRVSG